MKTIHLFKSIAAATVLVITSLSASASVNTSLDIGFENEVGRGIFGDIIEFVLPETSSSFFSVFASQLNGSKTTLDGFTLYSNKDTELFTEDDTKLASGVFDGGQSATISFDALSAGSYFLHVTGIAKSTLGGRYSGSISATPVPEPETFAMLLAGLGVMGAIARRRKI